MRFLFIGLFILAFLAGVAALTLKGTEGQPTLVHDVFQWMGLEQHEQSAEKDRQVRLAHLRNQKSKMGEILRSIGQNQEMLMNNVRDQQQFLRDSNKQVSSLSEMVRNVADKNNMDLLKLKQTMADFEEQNRLLIQNGNQLIQFNEQIVRNRQQTLDRMNVANIDSGLNQQRLIQYTQESAMQRENFIKQNLVNIENMQEKARNLNEQVHMVETNLNNKIDPALIEKLKEITTKSHDIFENVSAQQKTIRDEQQEQSLSLDKSKEKMNDQIAQAKIDSMSLKQRMDDQKRQQEDRARDQMENLKNMREK